MKDSRRLENGDGGADYDIAEMWRRLQQEEPEALKDALIFNHGETGRSPHARRSGEESHARDTNPSVLTNELGLGNSSPKYNSKQQRKPGASKGLGEASARPDFMAPGSQRAEGPDARQA